MENLVALDNKRIGLFLSGGIDSAVLFFCLANTLKNSEFLLFTVTRDNDNRYNEPYVKQVVEYVQHKTNCKIISHEFLRFTNREQAQKHRLSHIKKLIDIYQLDLCANGMTANPKHLLIEGRDERRDNGLELVKKYHKNVLLYQPFADKDKKYVVGLIKKYNLEEFFNITISCESEAPPRPCGECWWCKERDWAISC